MKKVLAVILVIVLACLYAVPTFATENTLPEFEASYTTLKQASDSILKGRSNSFTKFSDLTEDVIDYLEENNIDTDRIGEVFYEMIDGVPTLVTLYYEDNDTLVLSTLTSLSRDEEGNYNKVAAPGSNRSGWFVVYPTYEETYTEVTVTTSIYISNYLEDMLNLYYRPFQIVFSYTNNSGYSPTVTNFYSQGVVRGKEYTYSGTNFTPTGDFYDWSVSRTVTSPMSGASYTESNIMTNGICIYEPYTIYSKVSLYINGQRKEFIYDHL